MHEDVRLIVVQTKCMQISAELTLASLVWEAVVQVLAGVAMETLHPRPAIADASVGIADVRPRTCRVARAGGAFCCHVAVPQLEQAIETLLPHPRTFWRTRSSGLRFWSLWKIYWEKILGLGRSKHINILHHFTRDVLKKKLVSVKHVAMDKMAADISCLMLRNDGTENLHGSWTQGCALVRLF